MKISVKKISAVIALIMMAQFSGCKKEADNPQWDIDVLGPVMNATLGIDQLVADSLQVIEPDGKVRIVLEDEIDNFDTDSVYTIPDTGIQTVYIWQFIPFTIPPGTPFFTNNKNILLNVKGAELLEAVIRKGNIRLTARNTLPTKVYFTYNIPEARRNGQPFSFSASVDSGSFSDPKIYTTTLDFSEYDVNLTGATFDLVNTFAYNVVARSDSAGPSIVVNPGDTLLNISTDMLGITPRYVKGYIGQDSFDAVDTFEVGIGNLFTGGQLLLDSARLRLDLKNNIGADIQAYISSIRSVNSRTGNSVNLSASDVLLRNLNINRAFETGEDSNPIRPSTRTLVMDNSNSNLNVFLQNLPDRIVTDLRYTLNPLGNVSGNNDFIFDDRLISTSVRLEIPLRLSTTDLTLTDTLTLSLAGFTDLEKLGDAELVLSAENGFPFDMDLQLLTIDNNRQVTDSLLIPGRIAAGTTDNNLQVTGRVRTDITIPLDIHRKNRLLSSPYLIIRAVVNSVGNPDYLYIYQDYTLKLKLILDGSYGIR
ncbi:MAG: hypothetical protein ACKOA1_02900 [Bacteroidota bacterium]